MSFIFFGSSIPVDIVNIVQVKRASSCTHATLKRESYLLNSIRSSRHDRIIFVTTGFSEEKASFPTKVYFNQGVEYVLLGYNGRNRFIKYMSIMFSIFIWTVKNLNKGDYACVYNFQLPYSLPLIVRKLFARYNLTIDFEDFYNKRDMRYYVNLPLQIAGLKLADAFIASSPDMASYLSLRSQKNIHINGGYPDYPVLKNKNKNKNKKNTEYTTLLYSGTLSEPRGILDLINVFKLNKNHRYKLVITGSGRISDDVMNLCTTDKRISYLGNLCQSDFNDIILKADICINPQWESVSINFPSKVTTYLSYGKLVLSTRHSALYKSDYVDYIEFYDRSNNEFWEKIFYLVENNSISIQAEERRMKLFSKLISFKTENLINFINTMLVK